jgi:hypothetical protein
MSQFYDNTGVSPPPQTGAVYYQDMYIRAEQMVVGPTGYGLVAMSNLSNNYLGHLAQDYSGQNLIYTNSLGNSYIIGGSTGAGLSETFIVQKPSTDLPNAQAINQLSNVTTGSVLTVLNGHTGSVAATSYLSDSSPAGSHNLFLGTASGTANGGHDNTGVGVGVLQNNTSGSGNCFLGNDCAFQLTTGNQNTGIGYHAGENLMTGSDNFLAGTNAGVNLSSGYQNVCIGTSSGNGYGTSFDNVAIGYQSEMNNPNAIGNVCVGNNTGSIQGASNNTCVGSNAFAGNGGTGYYDCVALGANAICGATGAIAIGYNTNSYGLNSVLIGTGTQFVNLETFKDYSACIASGTTGMAMGVNNLAPGYTMSIFSDGTNGRNNCCLQLQDNVGTPSTPASGTFILYGNGNHLYFMGDDGVQHTVV